MVFQLKEKNNYQQKCLDIYVQSQFYLIILFLLLTVEDTPIYMLVLLFAYVESLFLYKKKCVNGIRLYIKLRPTLQPLPPCDFFLLVYPCYLFFKWCNTHSVNMPLCGVLRVSVLLIYYAGQALPCFFLSIFSLMVYIFLLLSCFIFLAMVNVSVLYFYFPV